MWQCSFCSFSSSCSFNVARHRERKHKNKISPNVNEPEQFQLSSEQPTLQAQMPLQQSLQFVENQHLGNARAGPKEAVHSDDDDDAVSEYSSDGKQQDFFDADSDS